MQDVVEDDGHHHDAVESNSDRDEWQEGVVLARPPPGRKDEQGTAERVSVLCPATLDVTNSTYFADRRPTMKPHFVTLIHLLPHNNTLGVLSNGGGIGRLVEKLWAGWGISRELCCRP